MRTVITAAETGHLIIGTMHASSAYQAIDRILAQAGTDSRLVAQMLANNLLCIVAQNLIPARNATEQDPRRVLGYEVLFRTKDLAAALSSQQPIVPPAKIRELISAGGAVEQLPG
jgi:twitching motility protein PilT